MKSASAHQKIEIYCLITKRCISKEQHNEIKSLGLQFPNWVLYSFARAWRRYAVSFNPFVLCFMYCSLSLNYMMARPQHKN